MVELVEIAHCCTANTTPSPDSAPEDPPLVLLAHLKTRTNETRINVSVLEIRATRQL